MERQVEAVGFGSFKIAAVGQCEGMDGGEAEAETALALGEVDVS